MIESGTENSMELGGSPSSIRSEARSVGSAKAIALSDSAQITAIRNLASTWVELAAISDQLPSDYRQAAFAEFVRFTLEAARSTRVPVNTDLTEEPNARGTRISTAKPSQRDAEAQQISPLDKVERVLNVPNGSLSRVLQIGADGSVQIVARVEGRSIRDRQVRLSQIVCFVREKGIGEMKTDMEMLRTVCIAHGVYDSANFTANFRREGSLRETTVPGTRDRLYILSPDGVEAASALLRQLANT